MPLSMCWYEKIWLQSLHLMFNVKIFVIQDSHLDKCDWFHIIIIWFKNCSVEYKCQSCNSLPIKLTSSLPLRYIQENVHFTHTVYYSKQPDFLLNLEKNPTCSTATPKEKEKNPKHPIKTERRKQWKKCPKMLDIHVFFSSWCT